MPDVRHITFNPRNSGIGFDPVGRACREQEDDGYMLVHVVPITDYEAVLVFTRDATPDSSAQDEPADRNVVAS